MKNRALKRIEPGYYRVRGSAVEIIDRRGMSVRYSGLVDKPWRVRVSGEPGEDRFWTFREAKEHALKLANKKEGVPTS